MAQTNASALPAKQKKKSKIIKSEKYTKRAPLGFKLQLIAEVKKHEIIWENHSGSKNKDLLEDAWRRVRKALKVNKVQYCQHQWNLLKHGYRSQVNGNRAMKSELVAEMAFMEPQLKYLPNEEEQSKDEPQPVPEPTPSSRPVTPKAEKVQNLTRSEKPLDKKYLLEEQAVSLAIIDHLFVTAPAKTMAQARESLVHVFMKVQPEQTAMIIAHAQEQVRCTRNCLNIDWSDLALPDVICQAVWDNDVNEMIAKRLSTAESPRI